MAKDGEKLSTTIKRESWDRLSQLMSRKKKDRTKTVEEIIDEAWDRAFGTTPVEPASKLLGWSESRIARSDGPRCRYCGGGISIGQRYCRADADEFVVAHAACVQKEYQGV